MMSAGGFITRQSKLMLENKQYAILCAVIFSIVPFASWLSVALIALVTLRKGAKAGFEILVPALVIHSVPLIMFVSLGNVLINTLATYVPCYLAALCLRKTTSWQAVFATFLVQAFVAFLLIQLVAPDFIVDQFAQIKKIFTQYPEYQELIDGGTNGISSFILAQLFFGFQILSVIVSSIISLMFARSTQAKLFLPGGFRQELMEFRGNRLSFLVLVAVSIASYGEVPIAINLLPLVLCYFFVAGLSLAYFILARKRQIRVLVLLFLLIILKPFAVLFAYVVLGSLDSLFNLRLYLPTRVKESV